MEIKIALNTTGNEFMLQIGGGLRNEMKINYEFHNIRCD
jgi:hypothetical protein